MEAVIDRLQTDRQPARFLDDVSRRYWQQIYERLQTGREDVHLSGSLPAFDYARPSGIGDRPDTELWRSRFMSLGETIPTTLPPTTTSVRPSLQPAQSPRTFAPGSFR